MLQIYKCLTGISTPILNYLLKRRIELGKEDPLRFTEKKGYATKSRPSTPYLLWVHAASVGEINSALALIKMIQINNPNIHILITTGTLTSAQIVEKFISDKDNIIHQFYPLDHPKWVKEFLNHWKPSGLIWLESELWPNMLSCIKKNNIPAILINAQMSERSYKKWSKNKKMIHEILSTFTKIVAQNKQSHKYFMELSKKNVIFSGNIKYSAAPPKINKAELGKLQHSIHQRPLWLYASTHAGEEEIACEIHKNLKNDVPDLLTIIVPRHPERSGEIKESCTKYKLKIVSRKNNSDLEYPNDTTDIYLANTLGELGLFYTISPISVIGRSLSNDGGGGHNPIEAAQLKCCILTGPNVQNLQEIFDDMITQNTIISVDNKIQLQNKISELLSDKNFVTTQGNKAYSYIQNNCNVIDRIYPQIQTALNLN